MKNYLQMSGLRMMVATWCQQDLQITGRKDTHPHLSYIDLHPGNLNSYALGWVFLAL